jgi:hypothetical protein
VVYTGLRSDSIKNHASCNEARRIAAMRIIFTHIGCTLLTCDMYMSDLRHTHDPVLSSLKMEGILFFSREVKRSEHEADPSSPSKSEIKNEWSYLSTAVCLHGVYRDSLL